MKKQFISTCVLLVLHLGDGGQGAIIPLPSIDNPCQSDTTSTGTPQYLPILAQLELTITAATEAHTKCQVLKNALSTVLSQTEINLLESDPSNVTTPHSGHNDSTLASANALTRILRHTALNITVLYNIIEQVAGNATMQSYDQLIRNVMAAMLAVKCRLTVTSEVAESNFTTGESETEDELLMADYDAFISLEETINQQPLPSDEKDSIYRGYTVARYMQMFMAALTEALETEKLSIEQL